MSTWTTKDPRTLHKLLKTNKVFWSDLTNEQIEIVLQHYPYLRSKEIDIMDYTIQQLAKDGMPKLAEKIRECKACKLHKTVTNRVIGKGSPNPRILFIGEAPGKSEDETGVPFCGAAGKQLDKMVEYMKLKPEDWAVINIIKCRPPDNRAPVGNETEACKKFMEAQVEILNPEIIILLGETAASIFAPVPLPRGVLFTINSRQVIKLFHPAALLYEPSRITEQKLYMDLMK